MYPEELLARIKDNIMEKDHASIGIAYLIASNAHSKQKRYNGDPYIIHPLRVSLILIDELKIKKTNIIIIALLHDVIEDSDTTLDVIKTQFNDEVAEGVRLLTKSKGYKTDLEQQRKYFLHLKKANKNVQLVKLSDRLDNIRDLSTCKDILKQRRYIMDTAYNYLDWAKKTSPYIAGELEDLIFKYRDQMGDYNI